MQLLAQTTAIPDAVPAINAVNADIHMILDFSPDIIITFLPFVFVFIFPFKRRRYSRYTLNGKVFSKNNLQKAVF